MTFTANLAERRNLLLTMLDAVYVDTVEEKSIVAILPKPAFQPVFEIVTTKEGSDVVLINEPPPANIEPEAADSCFWWRRGRVELAPGVSTALRTIAQGLAQLADALDAGAGSPLDLAPILPMLTNGHHSNGHKEAPHE